MTWDSVGSNGPCLAERENRDAALLSLAGAPTMIELTPTKQLGKETTDHQTLHTHKETMRITNAPLRTAPPRFLVEAGDCRLLIGHGRHN